MIDILKEYPAPWKVVQMTIGTSIEAANGKIVIVMGEKLSVSGMLEFIAETINNSIKTRITDVPCECSCGWWGIVYDCEPDVDGEGSLGCPRCLKIVEVV